MVVVAHAPVLGGASYAGGLAGFEVNLGVGVWIFFSVSGFLIAGPFLRALMGGSPLPPIRRYARRRAARIIPAYWVAFAVLLALSKGRLVTSWWQIPVHALLVQGLVPNELQKVYFVAWTLSLEAIFYVLVPVAALAIRRAVRGRPVSPGALAAVIGGIWLLAIVESVIVAVASPLHGFRPLPGAVQILDLASPMACFCPGMLVYIAEAAQRRDGRWFRAYDALAGRPYLTLPLAVALFYASTRLHFETSHLAFEMGSPLHGVASGLVLATALRSVSLRPATNLLAPIGLFSYGIYLWHWVVIQSILQQHGQLFPGAAKSRLLADLVIVLALALPLGAASWLAVERPLIRRTTGWERRPQAAPPEPAAAAATT